MLKKIGMGLLIAILAFFALLYWQKGKIEQNLTAVLAQNQLQFRQAQLNLLPTPHVVISEPRYQLPNADLLQAQTLQLQFGWLNLLQGKLIIETLQLQQGELSTDSQPQPWLKNMQLRLNLPKFLWQDWVNVAAEWQQGKFSPDLELQLEAQSAEQHHISVQTKLAFSRTQLLFSRLAAQIQLHQQRLINADKLEINWGKGEISWAQNRQNLQFALEGFSVNQIAAGNLSGNISPSQLDLQFSNPQQESLRISSYNQPEIQLSGKNLRSLAWLKAMNLPPLVESAVDFEASFDLVNNQLQQAKFDMQLNQGKLNGINLLHLISQYAPINYDETQLAALDTPFEKLHAKFIWYPQHIDLQQLNLQQQHLNISGQGKMDLLQQRCDVHLQMRLNHQKYAYLSLPVHFWGDCQSPEYKVEINRTFRDQLKQIIREKLN